MAATSSVHIRTNLSGRVANLRISKSGRQILQPLFEAMSNSLQAIAESGRDYGLIAVEITRDETQRSLALQQDNRELRGLEEIAQIRITDNGHGFTERDFDSFLTLDSRHKAKIGGKGVGRLVWLKVFSEAIVESVYRTPAGEFHRRRFRFALPEGVTDIQNEPANDASATWTTVTLRSPRPEYAPALRFRASTIRDEIVRHFLSQLLADNPPKIEVREGSEVFRVALQDLPEKLREQFELKGQAFTVDHLKIKTPEARDHLIYYCANNRVVKSDKFKDLPRMRFEDTDGTPFYYQAYLASPILDESVNQERTDFNLPQEASDLADEISLSEIRTAVQAHASGFLQPYLGPLQERKEARIERVLGELLPEYRYIRYHNSEDLSKISLDASEQEIEEAVSRIHFQNQLTGKKLLEKVVREMEQHATFDVRSFIERFDERFEDLNRVNRASLLSYLLFRKSIIDIFAQVLRKTDNRFEREAAVHNLLFPMGKEHDPSEAYAEHNLWMIDERLTYANYIASDRPINQHKMLFDATGRGEPDLTAYYFNLGFSAGSPEAPLHNVVIVEFKRPGPLGRLREDPYQQVLRYIDEINAGTYNHAGDRIKASKSTRFYCYIVCELDDEEVTRMIRTYQFQALFDGDDGYFLYNREVRAYVEIVPFARMLRDAKRNHKIFFEKAGILTED